MDRQQQRHGASTTLPQTHEEVKAAQTANLGTIDMDGYKRRKRKRLQEPSLVGDSNGHFVPPTAVSLREGGSGGGGDGGGRGYAGIVAGSEGNADISRSDPSAGKSLEDTLFDQGRTEELLVLLKVIKAVPIPAAKYPWCPPQ